MTAPTYFLALLPGLDDQQGHQYDYGRAVQAAVAITGWQYTAAVPITCRIDPLPPQWVRALDRGNYRFDGNLLRKLRSIGVLGASIGECLRTHRPADGQLIVFVEFFNDIQLLALWIGLLRQPPAHLGLWLVYRLPVHQGPRRWAYRLLQALINQRLGQSRVKLMTDSAPLARALEPFFGKPLVVLPIPHGVAGAPEPALSPAWPTPRTRYVAWWPGRAAPDKGLAQLHRLAALSEPVASHWTIVATTEAALQPAPGGPKLHTLPATLSRATYTGWLEEADLVLLPYLAEHYQARTSGIFVEAIAAGKLAVVTAGTWMAQELLAHDLPELIMPWEAPDIWQRLTDLAENTAVRPRLVAMAAAYQRTHNPAGFAAALHQLAATPAEASPLP